MIPSFFSSKAAAAIRCSSSSSQQDVIVIDDDDDEDEDENYDIDENENDDKQRGSNGKKEGTKRSRQQNSTEMIVIDDDDDDDEKDENNNDDQRDDKKNDKEINYSSRKNTTSTMQKKINNNNKANKRKSSDDAAGGGSSVSSSSSQQRPLCEELGKRDDDDTDGFDDEEVQIVEQPPIPVSRKQPPQGDNCYESHHEQQEPNRSSSSSSCSKTINPTTTTTSTFFKRYSSTRHTGSIEKQEQQQSTQREQKTSAMQTLLPINNEYSRTINNPYSSLITTTTTSLGTVKTTAITATTTCYIPFTDPDFGPQASSLDGRLRGQQQQQQDNSMQHEVVIQCHCGLPAAAKRVQSDGSNYGRFYLACGRPTYRKKFIPTNNNNNPSPPQEQQLRPCNFFQWDKDGSRGAAAADRKAASGYSNFGSRKVSWHPFGLHNYCCLFQSKRGIVAGDVRQGAVGNCWFLSALAVVAERPYLIHRIILQPQNNTNHEQEQGRCHPDGRFYQVNLCLDGKWTAVTVDSYLPVVLYDTSTTTSSSSSKRKRLSSSSTASPEKTTTPKSSMKHSQYKDGVLLEDGVLAAFPAFCATPHRQLWAALIEKAYAKVHGSYAQLSGGFIAEGMHDLTGAPTETIVFESYIVSVAAATSATAIAAAIDRRDDLWIRLLSFHQAGYCMGVATNKGGEGLVGGHAYSILDVIQMDDFSVGEQSKVTDYFCNNNSNSNIKKHPNHMSSTTTAATKTTTTIRLVRIRNPWGKCEWKGEWSADSEQWTRALRKRLESSHGANNNNNNSVTTTYAKGDGTFFMAFEDMLERFHHLDVAKTREGWVHASSYGEFQKNSGDPMTSCRHVFRLTPSDRTWAFISLIQPKKRANTNSTYWYCDVSMVILKRPILMSEDSKAAPFTCESVILSGIQRSITCECFLDPTFEYACVVFSCLGGGGGASSALRGGGGGSCSFRITAYSAESVTISKNTKVEEIRIYREEALSSIQKHLLRCDHKLLYSVARQGLLACIQGDGCMYFMIINGSPDAFLSIKLVVDVKQNNAAGGMIAVVGLTDATHDVGPRSQQVVLVLSRSGTFSARTEIKFSYMSSTVPISKQPASTVLSTLQQNSYFEEEQQQQQQQKKHQSLQGRQRRPRMMFTGRQSIRFAGDLLASSVNENDIQVKGSATVDTYLWIPQLGSAAA